MISRNWKNRAWPETLWTSRLIMFQTIKQFFVNASSVNEAGLAAVNTAYFLTEEPEIIFYENRPTEGISYENALGNTFLLKNEEVTLAAEPYFFSAVQNTKDTCRLSGRSEEMKWPEASPTQANSRSNPQKIQAVSRRYQSKSKMTGSFCNRGGRD